MSNLVLLVVEDNEDDVFALRWALKRAGVQADLHHVEDGQAAVDYLGGAGVYYDRERHPLPHLVLLDLKLPYLSGMEVLEWVRRSSPIPNLPVVILSGSDEARDHERAEALSAQGYLVKPPLPEQIKDLLAAYA